jgi:hypothetical protein
MQCQAIVICCVQGFMCKVKHFVVGQKLLQVKYDFTLIAFWYCGPTHATISFGITDVLLLLGQLFALFIGFFFFNF